MAPPTDPSSVLLPVVLQLAATRSLDGLLPVVLDHIVDLLGAERALFALFDEDGAITAAQLKGLSWTRGTPLPISNSAVAKVLRRGEEHEVIRPEFDGAMSIYESARLHGLRYIIAVPVEALGRVAGVLYADSTVPVRSESERRLEILRGLAAIVGIAVENASLHEEQRLRTLLLGKLVHDLKGQLLMVTLGPEVARGDVDDTELQEILEDVRLAGEKMKVHCESALRLAGIEGATPEAPPALLDVGATLADHARLFQRIAKVEGISLETRVEAGLPRPRTWPDRLSLALDNLIINALKYAATRSAVVLGARLRHDAGPRRAEPSSTAMSAIFRKVARATPDPDGGFIEVSVHNRGRPIDPELLPCIFDEWVRGDDAPRLSTSTGLGLAIVDQCVRSLGGSVWVESTAAEGTTFRLTIPAVTL